MRSFRDLLRALSRTFGISAPRMAVRAAIPWYWRALIGVLMAALVLTLARFTYEFGRHIAGFDRSEAESEVVRLAELTGRQQQELVQLRGQLATAERKLEIERATFDDLKRQVKTLTEANATLQDDLAFFQTLMPSSGKEGGITVNRFQVARDALPGEFRYRLLILQTGTRTRDFQGSLQFVVNLQQDSKEVVMMLPAESDRSREAFRLNFRFFQRVEGSFRVPPGATVKAMQVRVLEHGAAEPRLMQNATVL